MHSRFLPCLTLLAPLFVWACGSSEPPTSSGSGAITAGGKDDSSKAAPAPKASASAAASSSAPSTSAGHSSPDQGASGAGPDGACYDACDKQHPTGAQILAKAYDDADNCVCGASACGSQCGSSFMCSDADDAPDPSDACMQCFSNSAAVKACDQKTDSTCSATPDCVAAQSCYDACDAQGGPSK